MVKRLLQVHEEFQGKNKDVIFLVNEVVKPSSVKSDPIKNKIKKSLGLIFEELIL